MKHRYITHGVCSNAINFELNGDIVTNISYEGGCNGNLKAVAKLVDGMTVSQIEERLAGNTCGRNSTSCADQLAKAVKKAYEEENQPL